MDLDLKKQTIEGLKVIKCILDGFNIEFVLIGGLVLSYARYKDLMHWDLGDIDMGIFVPVPDIAKDRFLYIFKDFRTHHNLKVTLKFWEHKEGYFETLSSNGRYIFREDERWFLNPQSVEFLGTTFLIPGKFEDYLDNHYGKDWQTNLIRNLRRWIAEYRRHPEKYPYPIRIKNPK